MSVEEIMNKYIAELEAENKQKRTEISDAEEIIRTNEWTIAYIKKGLSELENDNN